MNLKTLKYFLEKPSRIIPMLGANGFLNWLSDETYLQLQAKQAFGRKLNLEQPQTFSEKLNWLKIHDRKDHYTQLVDKYAVRQYIAEKLGEQYLIPLAGGPWNTIDEIKLDELPEQFVLKTTHDSGGVAICRNKASFDFESAKKYLAKRLKRNYFYASREWPYKNMKPRIFAEQYLEDEKFGELRDYKFYCFGGNPKLLLLVTDRAEKDIPTKYTFFDKQFNKLPFGKTGPIDTREFELPEKFEEMKEIAALLSEGFPFIRVDLYEVNGNIYFGELTFYPSAALERFQPEEWDGILGSWIELPED